MRVVQSVLCAASTAAWLSASPIAQTRPAPQRPARPAISSDAVEGRRVFDAQCAWCHGNEGEGGMGPNLHGSLRHATTLASIVEIITNGIPGTDMPGFRSPLTERSIRQTAAYVQSLSRAGRQTSNGDAQRGAAIYAANGCAGCHVASGVGGILGPELTTIGSRRGAAYLREAIVKPAAAHPPGYLVVRAVPARGPEIRGIRVNEDVFWVHIRDAGGVVHALQKSDLTSLDRELDASLMPSYASRLKDAELDDLVAYLTSLRGAK
jgi:cytochrome c oxidase cbb3-type subunit 3